MIDILIRKIKVKNDLSCLNRLAESHHEFVGVDVRVVLVVKPKEILFRVAVSTENIFIILFHF